MNTAGLYIHIPYCRKKCLYCDFFSTRCNSADWDILAKAIVTELRLRINELDCPPDTLYFGGGTPSLMPTDIFRTLCRDIRGICGKRDDWMEFTIEVNPEDVTDENCLVWSDCGVGRVSMGVQSFANDELRTVGRTHDSAAAVEAYNILRRYFRNISMDIMFGLPGQTSDSWNGTVDKMISLRPEHISAYSLMFEPHTPLTVLRDRGRMIFPDEESCLAMWESLMRKVKDAGYIRYEISNYSLPGFKAVHNSSYWRGDPYLGIGPSAHSYDGKRIRKANPTKIKEYLQKFANGADNKDRPFYEEEILHEDQLLEEMVMLRLRTSTGINTEELSLRFGSAALERLHRNAVRHIEEGHLEFSDEYLSLTDSGIMLSDEIILDLCM